MSAAHAEEARNDPGREGSPGCPGRRQSHGEAFRERFQDVQTLPRSGELWRELPHRAERPGFEWWRRGDWLPCTGAGDPTPPHRGAQPQAGASPSGVGCLLLPL